MKKVSPKPSILQGTQRRFKKSKKAKMEKKKHKKSRKYESSDSSSPFSTEESELSGFESAGWEKNTEVPAKGQQIPQGETMESGFRGKVQRDLRSPNPLCNTDLTGFCLELKLGAGFPIS